MTCTNATQTAVATSPNLEQAKEADSDLQPLVKAHHDRRRARSGDDFKRPQLSWKHLAHDRLKGSSLWHHVVERVRHASAAGGMCCRSLKRLHPDVISLYEKKPWSLHSTAESDTRYMLLHV